MHLMCFKCNSKHFIKHWRLFFSKVAMKPIYKTKKREKRFSRKEVVLYLQSLQLLQILEGASLNDADLVVFQMPRSTEAGMVKDKRGGSGILMPGFRPCSHGHSAPPDPQGLPSWDQSSGTR